MIFKAILFISLTMTLFAKELGDDFFKELQNDLDKYSKIAIETKQNVDYMPYVVSVLKNEDMVKLGILSLREALSLIPGVDISVGMAGVKNPIFRGSNPFAMGQSKLTIDGVVVNDKMFGAYYQYLDMPIDIIQRIEVVRGPGSLQSDVNAYSGSIHVITKVNRDDGNKKENLLFATYGSDNHVLGGFVSSYKADNLEVSSDFFYQEHDKALPVGEDRFHKPDQPQNAPQWLKNYALGLNASYKDLYFKGRFARNKSGVSYGQSFSITEFSDDYLDIENNFLELGYKLDISSGIKAKLSVGYFDENRELLSKVMPDNSWMIMPNDMNMTFPLGYYFHLNQSEQTFSERLEFKISTFEYHKITAGIVLRQSRVGDNIARHSRDNLASFNQITKLIAIDRRDQTSLYVDDLININENTSVQLGLKYDSFSDIDDQVSPRFALVHRYNDDNIYKITYTHSFREPSWREKYLVGSHRFNSDVNVGEEKVDAYEASYIRKINIDTDLKFNIFYLENQDQIHAQNSSHQFTNNGNNELYGLEAEFKTRLRKSDKFYVNYSYVDGKNVASKLAGSAQNMLKLYYIYALKENLNISSIVQYVGEKDRIEGDDRANVHDHITADFSVGYLYKPYDLTLSASLKNAFDEKYYLPAPVGTYDDDFEQEGRSFLVRLSKRF